ncbi:MAG: lytic murein transglycosylase B [Gammaproteobacteria bacterium]|nr:lytic murein transglycosylase B [Gammaproteobacteria bacterium]
MRPHCVLHQLLFVTLFISTGMLTACAANTPRAFDDPQLIDQFIAEMVTEYQFKPEPLQQLFSKARLQPAILDAIARPAETKSWRDYRPLFLSPERIRGGVSFMNEYSQWLERASDIYGIPPQIVTAIIGVESRYGKQSGNYPLIDSLSTLGFAYPPRAGFFRGELKQFLLMTREEAVDPLSPRGSYAGAMGLPQFIPSSFRRFAVDFDADGKRDLWNSPADAIGSVANYFEKHGWHNFEAIATRVQVKGDKYTSVIDDNAYPRFDVRDLRSAGVLLPGDTDDSLRGSLIVLDGGDGPEYWVAWHNFYVITRYNHSVLYAMAVYQLSREIVAARWFKMGIP